MTAKATFGAGCFWGTQAAFQNIPLSNIFLETDTTHSLNISDVYNKAAELKLLSLDELKSAVFHNFARVFS